MAAVNYVHTLPYVDGGRVAVVGCWFGGVDALLAAERGKGIAAAVDFGGAVQPWHASVILQDRLKLAARNARVPVFFLQAANDFDTKPTVELGAAMQAAGKPTRVRVLPPFGSSSFEGHSFCMGGGETQWGPEVLDFLQTTMGHRPPT
jgi:dienelactone hydrolase